MSLVEIKKKKKKRKKKTNGKGDSKKISCKTEYDDENISNITLYSSV